VAFTYDLAATGDDLLVSKVRLEIPDTDSVAYELEDAEILYYLDTVGNSILRAAVKCCRQLARKYAQKHNFTADGVTVNMAARAEAFSKRADELERSINGGISSIDLDRQDGWSDEAADSEYDNHIVYIRTR